jgi:superfamily II DNA/RNA helicase
MPSSWTCSSSSSVVSALLLNHNRFTLLLHVSIIYVVVLSNSTTALIVGRRDALKVLPRYSSFADNCSRITCRTTSSSSSSSSGSGRFHMKRPFSADVSLSVSGKSNNTKAAAVVDSTVLSKHLQSNNHFFSQKSLEDPRFYTIKTSQNEEVSSSNVGHDLFRKLCRASSITRPSRIQALAWPVLLQNQHCLVADQTGSGKSYAYLIPLIIKMKQQQQQQLTTSARAKNAPNILILTPTSELASQIYNVCKKLCKHVPFRSELILSAPVHQRPTNSTSTSSSNTNNEASIFQRNQVRALTDPKKPPVDILVATPGRVASLLRAGHLDFTHLQSLVLDEVDVLMMEETFGPQLKAVGVATPLQTQFVFVTATLPDSIVQSVTKEFPTVQIIKGPGLHRIAPTLQELLVDVSVPTGVSNRDAAACFQIKAEELSKALRKNKSDRTLIFCNTVESCRSIENYLKRRDRRGKLCSVGAYHGAMSSEARNKELEKFCSNDGNEDKKKKKNGNKNSSDDDDDGTIDRILVCTDRAARGSCVYVLYCAKPSYISPFNSFFFSLCVHVLYYRIQLFFPFFNVLYVDFVCVKGSTLVVPMSIM